MLMGAIENNNPTIIIEHRWLHGTKGLVPDKYYKTTTEDCKVVKEGSDVSLISSGYGVIECIIAARELENMV